MKKVAKGDLRLSWEKDKNAARYVVEQYHGEVNKEIVRIDNTEISSIVIPGITVGVENHFKISYFNNNSRHEYCCYREQHLYSFLSKKQTVNYFFPTPIITSVERIGSGIKVKWKSVGEKVTYLVIRRFINGKWMRIGLTDANYYIDRNIDENKKYFYSIRCVDKEGKELLSSFSTKGVSVS